MSQVEYKVMPAPTRGRKGPGTKTPEGRFALGLEDMLNEMAQDGWTYLRSDILPSTERHGLASSQTVYRSVLVFRREMGSDGSAETRPPDADSPALTLARTLNRSESQE